MSIFNSIRLSKPKTTRFNLTHNFVGDCGFGALVPFEVLEVLPGDKPRLSAEALVQSFPLLAPIYGDVDVKLEYFFSPNRIVWEQWQDFITGGEDGTAAPMMPRLKHITGNTFPTRMLKHSLWDYFGLPMNGTADPAGLDGEFVNGINNIIDDITALPFMHYRQIWNDWYRNENLQEELSLDPSTAKGRFWDIQYRNWRKDYFTSALPFLQRGVAPLVQVDGGGASIDFTSSNIVLGKSSTLSLSATDVEEGVGSEFWSDTASGAVRSSTIYVANKDSSGNVTFKSIESSNYGTAGNKEMLGTVVSLGLDNTFDLSFIQNGGVYYIEPNIDAQVGGTLKFTELTTKIDANTTIDGLTFDINELRRVNAVQRWLEMNARAGGRYIEQILSHFGVRVPDYRLDRSDFIGGFTQSVNIGQVFQQNTPSKTPTDTDALGYTAGTATSALSTRSYRYKVKEHGYIFGLMSIIPRASYFEGIDRKFLKSDKFDYYFPEFSHLGEEPVYNKELFVPNTTVNNQDYYDGVFGYQSRYSSYKWSRDLIVGSFRDTLNYWTVRREFNNPKKASPLGPTLSPEFVSLNPNTSTDETNPNVTLNDIFAVPSNDAPFRFYVKSHVDIRRPMPKYATPRL